MIEIVEGRKDDFIRTESGTLVHAAYLCYALKDDTVQEFKMYQKPTGSLLVQLVTSQRFMGDTEQALEARLRSALGDRIAISFEHLQSIPREVSGKLRYFVSEIDDAGRRADREEQAGPVVRS